MNGADRLARLEARVRELEDVEKIRERLSTYAFNADVGRVEEYLDGWTDDSVYDITEDTKLSGRAQLETLLTAPDGLHKKEIENRSQHIHVNLVIKVRGDRAWAEGYSLVPVVRDGAITILTTAYNHWEFARSGDEWLMTLRQRRTVGGPTWGGEVLKSYLT